MIDSDETDANVRHAVKRVGEFNIKQLQSNDSD